MKIKNLLFQPVTLHLAIDNEGLHLNAREVKDVLANQVSREIKRAAERGLVSIIGKVVTPAIRIPSNQTSNDTDNASISLVDGMPINPKKGNRK
jgi:hypothetical protein